MKLQQQGQTELGPSPSPSPSPAGIPVVLKKGDAATLQFGKEEVTFYGNLDVSYDVVTKGLKSFYPAPSGAGTVSPIGNVGWQSDISTNLSYFGVKGTHKLPHNLGLVYQLETQIDVSSTSGTPNSSSISDSIVKGGLTSRNSFIGLSSKYFGAVKLGKTDAPYKTSTARLNPFSGELGDYSVIVGNSGGDNRVEFGARLDHAIWYESPTFGGGFAVNALISPGQNRGELNNQIPSGEVDCTGGNLPGSGALAPVCTDGSYGSVFSYSGSYTSGKTYLTAAYEVHKNVNRSSDFAVPDPRDVGDEDGYKAGLQYSFSKRTIFSGLYEQLHRYIAPDLNFQNERQRNDTWVALTQYVSPNDSLNFGWGHAYQALGDPGQHNSTGGANTDNSANLYTFAFKHALDRHTSLYLDYAMTANHASGHYDLGAGGRGVTTDCHDGSPELAFDPTSPTAVSGVGPQCFTGGKLQGISTGLKFTF